jgi:hypothetical protein
MPSGYRVLDGNGIVLAHVYGQPDGALAVSDTRLTNNEARRISKLIARLPELVELETDRNKARSCRRPQPLHFKPVTVDGLIREGKLLDVHCGNCRPERPLYLNPEILGCRSACRCQWCRTFHLHRRLHIWNPSGTRRLSNSYLWSVTY